VLVSEIKVGLAQTNPVVGDFEYNHNQILDLATRAHEQNLDLVVFGELALCGYPLGDLSYRSDVVDASEAALKRLAKSTASLTGLTIVVGHVTRSDTPSNQTEAIAHNSASVLLEGRIVGTYHKRLLPNYDVFDDWRNFVPGAADLIFEVAGKKVALAICEDIWETGSSRGSNWADLGVELIVVPNGSPFTRTKQVEREMAAREFASGIPLAYVNLAGGQDEIVFDGRSFLISSSGEKILMASGATGLFTLESKVAESSDQETLFEVLVTGLRDYLAKTNQKSVVLGLSGGIDSALSAVIAVEAIGKENVLGVALPSRYSSDHSLSDAKLLADNLGIEYRIIPIEPAHAVFEKMLNLSDLAKENLQARLRAVIMMGISNSEGNLLLSTGNKSEVAVGYSTMYGDSAGGFAPIKDVFKTDVWALASWYNTQIGKQIIPQNSISKAPSAELRPGQVDQDSLPDYEILDRILALLIEEVKPLDEIIAAGFNQELVRRVDHLVRAAEWKRSQGAIGTKTTKVAFGRGRRVPLTTRFETL
jgi:NAD+ synthase (glutamine-hydrolysing)